MNKRDDLVRDITQPRGIPGKNHGTYEPPPTDRRNVDDLAEIERFEAQLGEVWDELPED